MATLIVYRIIGTTAREKILLVSKAIEVKKNATRREIKIFLVLSQGLIIEINNRRTENPMKPDQKTEIVLFPTKFIESLITLSLNTNLNLPLPEKFIIFK